MGIEDLSHPPEFETRADEFIKAVRETAARMTSEGLSVSLITEKPSLFFIEHAAMVAKRMEEKNPDQAKGILQMADELDKETSTLCKVRIVAFIEDQIGLTVFSDEVAELAEKMNAVPNLDLNHDPEGDIDILEDDPEDENRSDDYTYYWENNYIFA